MLILMGIHFWLLQNTTQPQLSELNKGTCI